MPRFEPRGVLMRTLLLVLLLALLPALPVSAFEKVEVLTTEVAPYVTSSRRGTPQGAMIRMARAAFLASGVYPEFVFSQWPDTAQKLGRGAAVVAMPAVETRERREYALFSEPLMDIRTVLFSLSRWQAGDGDPVFGVPKASLNSLDPGTVCRELLTRLPGQVVEILDVQDALRALLDGRVQYVALDERVGWAAIHRLYPGGSDWFVSSRHALEVRQLRLMFSMESSRSKRLRTLFDAGLRQIRERAERDPDGTLPVTR